MGLVDFGIPITLNDGTVLGSVIGGQVLPENPDEDAFRRVARAGDLGKGFAVVATEVQKLAKGMAESSKEIASRLSKLIDTINKLNE